jgi:type IV secretory pathway VirB10-like protein
MAMDAKERKKLTIQIIAGVVVVALLGFFMWFMFAPSSEQKKQEPLNPSDPMIPSTPEPTTAISVPDGTLMVNPESIQFKQDMPDTVVFQITAMNGPVKIRSALIPQLDADALTVNNIDCPVFPEGGMLSSGKTCTASVTWNGTRSVNSTLTIGTGDNPAAPPVVAGPSVNVPGAVPGAVPGSVPGGVPAAANGQGQGINIPITAVSTKAPVAPNGQPTPVAQATPVPAPQETGATSSARGMSPMQTARENYLAGRRGVGFGSVTPSQGLMPAATSPYASWDNIGVQGTKSSFPTDMSRVVTPDKPMTAVLTYQIDTRQAVTAVATIDRDVYGSSGRTVVIPRGTKVIGSLGGNAQDRVGIAWKQLIRPDGVRFVFEGASGDAMGKGGIPGKINERLLERYGYSLLPNIVSAGLTAALGGQGSTVANNGGTTQTMDARAVAAQILNQPLNQIAQDIYQRKSQMPIQITVPAGTRITIWSTGDLRLKPAGEPDVSSEERNQTANNRQGSSGQAQQNGFNPYGSGNGGSGGSQQMPQQNTGSRSQGSSAGSYGNDDASLQVGRVDANGNYIAPNSVTPSPRSIPMQGGN